ncbi:MAG: ankyrin repeat domain-containing protein [Planctomycetaceae bacterium]|nr:MAG: ankyrin repeat domain-containing protein [Planctomycetaceae bacterium]
MTYVICYTVQAKVVDHDGTVVSSDRITRQLEGLACHDDSVLNYAELPFDDECSFQGGHPRLTIDSKGQLLISVEVQSNRKLTRNEINALREDFEAQITDGIGAGCFDDLSAATGLSIEVRVPLRTRFTQDEGQAWIVKPATARGNEKRIAAVAKLVDQMDVKPQAPRVRVASVEPANSVEPAVSEKAATRGQPNFSKLFRLLAKPERNSLFDQIKAEVEACGNDLSSIGDGQYPYGNFGDPKLLRLLLNAGLPPNILDEKGHSLLIQAAGSPKCMEMLLKLGLDVNRICDDVYRSTALHRAAHVGSETGAKFLLANGADPSIKNEYGKIPQQCVNRLAPNRKALEALLQPPGSV